MDTLYEMFENGVDGDLNVLLDKLAFMVRKHNGDNMGQETDVYYVPEDFDFTAAKVDFRAFFNNVELVAGL